MADFDPGGSFTGVIYAPPNDYFVKTQLVNGKWHVASSLLFFEWDWVQTSAAYHEEVPIQISNLSADKLEGVDKWMRFWEFERINT